MDANGEPIIGASVRIEGTGLEGPLETGTDLDGKFQFQSILSGECSVRVEAMGYGTVIQSHVPVESGAETTLDFYLSDGEPDFSWGCGAPMIDTRETELSVVFQEEPMDLIPAPRGIGSYFAYAPGADPALDGERGIAVHGASVQENMTFVKKVNVTNPVSGSFDWHLPLELFWDLEAITGGGSPKRNSGTGGLFLANPKRGSNEFHGELWATSDPSGLSSAYGATDLPGYEIGKATRYDFGFALGGPIVEDRFWYFVAYSPSRWSVDHERSIRNSNEYEPSSDRNIHQEGDDWSRSDRWALVLSARLSDRHSLYLTVHQDRTESSRDDNWEDSLCGRANRMSRYRTGGTLVGLDWYTTWTGWFFQEVNLAWTEGRDDRLPHAGGAEGFGPQAHVSLDFEVPLALSPGFGEAVFSEWETFQFGAEWTWLYNGHEVSWGIRHEAAQWDEFRDYTGGRLSYLRVGRYIDPSGNPYDWTDPDNYLYEEAYRRVNPGFRERGGYTAAFLQDGWYITDYFRLIGGLRYEINKIKTDAGPTVSLSSLSPRVGFTWDPAHNSKSKLYGSFGRYALRPPLEIARELNGRGQLHFLLRYGYDGGMLRHKITTGDLPAAVQAGTKLPYEEEWILGFEYELAPDFAVGVRGIYRSMERYLMTYDTGDRFVLANPGPGLGEMPVMGNLESFPGAYTFTQFPGPTRIYRGLEVIARKRYSWNWYMEASYVFSRLTGNTDGYGNVDRFGPPRGGGFGTGNNSTHWAMANANGILSNDRTHRIKILGGYRFDSGLSLGAIFLFQSGTPLSKEMDHPVGSYGDEIGFAEPRGKSGRLPSTWTLDLHVGYDFKIRKSFLSLFVDVFNVTDNRKTTAVHQRYLVSNHYDPDWGREIARQAPRRVRLGVRWSF